jgi:predicted RNA-binding protein with RPS1 domain
MSGPAGVRRRFSARPDPVAPSAPMGPPEPARCPHCGLDVIFLAVHVAEAHPEEAERDAAAEREAREQEAARQARVAAELAEREAEAARRKAEARARRQEIEGLPIVPPAAGPARSGVPEAGKPAAAGVPAAADRAPSGEAAPRDVAASPAAQPADEAWARLGLALAQRTVLTGVVRSVKPFGAFVDLGGIDGLVRREELPVPDAAPLQAGQRVRVVVLAMRSDPRRVELSMRAVESPRPAPREREAPRGEPRRPEGPMALAFRLAQEKKQRGE